MVATHVAVLLSENACNVPSTGEPARENTTALLRKPRVKCLGMREAQAARLRRSLICSRNDSVILVHQHALAASTGTVASSKFAR
jgi:hypothetical protein